MSIRNIDKGFVYAPTHVQIQLTGATSGILEVDYVILNKIVFLSIPGLTFTATTGDMFYATLPPECCLSTSSKQFLFLVQQHLPTSDKVQFFILNVSNGQMTWYGDNAFGPFIAGHTYKLSDQSFSYLLVD